MGTLTLFLSGDVMTGRGVDQVLATPSDPELREPVVRDARRYVDLAEAAHGVVPRPVAPAYPWGEGLAILDAAAPDVRIINLETSVTRSSDFAPGKAVHYRMHPANIGCLTAVRPDVCVLANNHVLDFGPDGLAETLDTLDAAGLAHAGAGRTLADAERPAVVHVPQRRVVVHAVGTESSGVPASWAARPDRPGVAFLPELSEAGADDLLARVRATAQDGDLVVVSVHAGSNWGYDVPRGFVRLAHRLLDGGVHVVHGHSSHHPRPVEVRGGGLALYGCGDLVNDYEGIGGEDRYRADLRLLHLAAFDDGAQPMLRWLRMVPLRARRLRLERASGADTAWLRRTLDRASRPFGTRVEVGADRDLVVRGG